MSSEPRCETCMYYINQQQRKTDSKYGGCRRWPPTRVPDSTTETVWPAVSKWDSCGEYAPKAEP